MSLKDQYEWELIINDGGRDETGVLAEAFASESFSSWTAQSTGIPSDRLPPSEGFVQYAG